MLQPSVNIVLMGLRGSGKSTVGRVLAGRLGRAFVDLDDVTPRVLGRASVAEAWASDGEPAFRKAEAQGLERQLQRDSQVIALGGGTPTAPGAAEMLRGASGEKRAVVVYLRAVPDELRKRLEESGASAHRPSLTGAGVLDEIAEVFERRDPVYAELADHIVEVGGMTVEECVVELVRVCGG